MLFRAGMVYAYLCNFFLYRLLITKSILYDPMSRMQKLTRITWWVIHGLYLPILLYGIAATWIWSREFIVVEGNLHCVENITTVTPSAFLAIDLIISLCCLCILASPPFLAPSDKRIRIVVFRNAITMLGALCSTFFLLLYAIIGSKDKKERFFVMRIFLKLGALDAIINVTCVTLSWPIKFYSTVMYENFRRIQRTFGCNCCERSIERNASGNSNQKYMVSAPPGSGVSGPIKSRGSFFVRKSGQTSTRNKSPRSASIDNPERERSTIRWSSRRDTKGSSDQKSLNNAILCGSKAETYGSPLSRSKSRGSKNLPKITAATSTRGIGTPYLSRNNTRSQILAENDSKMTSFVTQSRTHRLMNQTLTEDVELEDVNTRSYAISFVS
mmetsp:Transcript_10096/g.15121  ORF Transcript_10096/g.15121 Transcript_10096/m.15121 type:complete len:385 (+) Transcript_10096:1-1155(+)